MDHKWLYIRSCIAGSKFQTTSIAWLKLFLEVSKWDLSGITSSGVQMAKGTTQIAPKSILSLWRHVSWFFKTVLFVILITIFSKCTVIFVTYCFCIMCNLLVSLMFQGLNNEYWNIFDSLHEYLVKLFIEKSWVDKWLFRLIITLK